MTNNQITVYSKNSCRDCDQVKFMFDVRDIAFEEIKVSDEASITHFKSRFPGVLRLPLVVIDGVTIGGKTQARAWLEAR